MARLRSLHIRLYDLFLTVESDHLAFLNDVERFFARALGSQRDPVGCHAQEARFALIHGSGAGSIPAVIRMNTQVHPLPPGEDWLMRGLAQLVLFATAQVRSHLLIHAGVVSSEEGAILLVADSMHGKTTLVLELVRRGFGFLSDEIAAIGRGDRLVHPYPRALSIRPGTLDLTGIAPQPPNWHGKLVVDIEEIFPGCLGAAVPIRHVVLLASMCDPASGSDSPILLRVNRVGESLVTALGALPAVSSVLQEPAGSDAVLTLRGAIDAAACFEILACCRASGVLPLSLGSLRQRPRFAESARLAPISAGEAIGGLLGSLHAGYHAALVHEQRATALFLDLAAAVQHASCHRLVLGPHQENADLICALSGH